MEAHLGHLMPLDVRFIIIYLTFKSKSKSKSNFELDNYLIISYFNLSEYLNDQFSLRFYSVL